MISVTTPLGLTRAFTCKVTPVFSEEMRADGGDVATGGNGGLAGRDGTWVPTLIDAGMLSVAIRLGSEIMCACDAFSLRLSIASSSRPLSTRVPTEN